jgi:hypothetical protein
MGQPNGAVAGDTDGGKPAPDAVNGATDGAKDAGGSHESLFGYDVEGPATEPVRRGHNRGGRKPGGRVVNGRYLRAGKSAKSDATGTTTEEKESVHLNKISLDSLLYSLHLMGAEILSVPELELDKEECKKLGDAIQEVGKHYAMAFDPKHVAILNLCVVMGMIYGTRIAAVRTRTKKNAPAKATPIAQVPKQPPQPRGAEVWNPEQSPSALMGEMSGGL